MTANVAALASLALAGYWLPAPAALSKRLRRVLEIGDRACGATAVALTFDDGPHPAGTPAVLEALAGAGLRATFFLVGEQVSRRPALAAEIVAAGHEVALHGHRHRPMPLLTPRQTAEDLDRGGAAVSEATGRPLRFYRPPYGLFTAAGLALCRRRGLAPVLWTRHGRDWGRGATAESISARLGPGLVPGAVVLLHDADFYASSGSWRRTAAALPALFEEMGHRGLGASALDARTP